jgi:hypothetical protein
MVMASEKRKHPTMRARVANVLTGLMAVSGAVAVAGILAVSAAPAHAAAGDFGFELTEAAVTSNQAGAHSDFTTTFDLKREPSGNPFARLRDLSVELPPGLIANPTGFPTCTPEQLAMSAAFLEVSEKTCPQDSQVGVAEVHTYQAEFGEISFREPIYLMQPPGGDLVARLGFVAFYYPTYINVEARSESDYGLTATLSGVSSLKNVVFAKTTLWGNPASPSHDADRITPKEAVACQEGHSCNLAERSSGLNPTPFMTNPTRCGVPLQVGFAASSYQEPEVSVAGPPAPFGSIAGCGGLGFKPTITVAPTTPEANAPTGLDVDVKVPQDEDVNDPAASELRNVSVTLPPGVTISPGAADGLAACSAAEAGFGTRGASHCPDAAKIGTATIDVPALSHPLQGAIYQRTPEPGNLFQIWLVASELGVNLKLPGEIHVDPATGQITSTFADNPQVPLREIQLHFFGGPRAPLSTPSSCGTYQTDFAFTPWSGGSPVSGVAPMTIDQGCGGGGFSPKLQAGVANPLAGRYSSFVLDLTRESGEQNVSALDVAMPSGLLAKLAGVPLCGAEQAQTGNCPAASQVGTTSVASGPGSSPLWIPQPGKAPTAVFLAGPYKGAPFSLVVRVPAQAGPFDLGTVVTRAGIYLDPRTTRVTVKTDPLPQILEGVPIRYRAIRVDIDRPGFTLNPTNCGSSAIGATVASAQGASASPSAPFQVGECGRLGFKPGFKVATSGKTSKADGASLKVKVQPPAEGPQNAPGGSSSSAKPEEANIKSVKVELPKQLPSRLTTLQKACTAQQFDADPAGCPAASVVGTAIAHTPLLSSPLTGPAYFVSHGGEAFPQLIIVLQGEGITVDLTGDTFISKQGITSSTFKEVPDVPVSSFELTLPQGPHSALTSNASLCAQPLSMPVAFTGQNGAVLKEVTSVEVEGCSNALAFASHSIKGRTLTVSVYAPAAGKLSVGGKGLDSVTKTAKRRETITVKLTQKRAGRLKTTVKATFTPSNGRVRRKQAETLRLQFRK